MTDEPDPYVDDLNGPAARVVALGVVHLKNYYATHILTCGVSATGSAPTTAQVTCLQCIAEWDARQRVYARQG